MSTWLLLLHWTSYFIYIAIFSEKKLTFLTCFARSGDGAECLLVLGRPTNLDNGRGYWPGGHVNKA